MVVGGVVGGGREGVGVGEECGGVLVGGGGGGVCVGCVCVCVCGLACLRT